MAVALDHPLLRSEGVKAELGAGPDDLILVALVQLRDLRMLADSLRDYDLEAIGPECRRQLIENYLVREKNLSMTVMYLRANGVG